MKIKPLSLNVSSAIGKVSAELTTGSDNTCIMTLAHGAGAGMQHPFMVSLSQSLAAAGIATLRFNFAFTENKKGRPDTPAVAHQVVQAAIKKAQHLLPGLPLFVSGKSFGGRMSSQYLAANPGYGVTGLVFYGFPLHPPGKPGVDRAEHLQQISIPMLFIQGSKDEFATPALIKQVCGTLPTASLVTIEGADHGFKAGKKEIMDRLVSITSNWTSTTAGS